MVTKHPVLDAGSVTNTSRRRILRVMGAGLVLGPTGMLPMVSAESKLIVPHRVLNGARLIEVSSQPGMPDNIPQAFGSMTFFVFPLALAATATDLYIADPGLGGLLRYDLMLDAMAPIRGPRVTQLTRLGAMPDGSVMVSNGGLVPIARYWRNGRVMQHFGRQLGGANFDEVVADPRSGRMYGLDRVQGRVDEVMPHGGGATIVGPGVIPLQPMAIAMDSRFLYVAGQNCACIEAIDLFTGRDKFVIASDLGRVTAFAANDDWLVVADASEYQIRIYRESVMRGDLSYAQLGLTNPSGIAIANNQLYIADPASRKIAIFRLNP